MEQRPHHHRHSLVDTRFHNEKILAREYDLDLNKYHVIIIVTHDFSFTSFFEWFVLNMNFDIINQTNYYFNTCSWFVQIVIYPILSP